MFWDKVVSNRLREMAKKNPDEAAVAVARIHNPLDFSVRGEMAVSLDRRGRREEARALARAVIGDYRNAGITRELFLDFASFIHLLIPVSDDLFLEAWTLALQKRHPEDQTNRVIAGKDGQAVGFTGVESVLLSEVRDHPNHRRVLNSMAESFPELHARLERIGGVPVLWDNTTRRYQPIGSANQSAADAEAMLTAPATSLKDRAVAAVSFLKQMHGRAILPEHSASLRGLLDELRSVNNADPLYPGRGSEQKPELRIELELLILWAGYHFEDALYRAENVSDPDFRSQVLRRIAEHLALSGGDKK